MWGNLCAQNLSMLCHICLFPFSFSWIPGSLQKDCKIRSSMSKQDFQTACRTAAPKDWYTCHEIKSHLSTTLICLEQKDRPFCLSFCCRKNHISEKDLKEHRKRTNILCMSSAQCPPGNKSFLDQWAVCDIFMKHLFMLGPDVKSIKCH
jgi:hypothetical protein